MRYPNGWRGKVPRLPRNSATVQNVSRRPTAPKNVRLPIGPITVTRALAVLEFQRRRRTWNGAKWTMWYVLCRLFSYVTLFDDVGFGSLSWKSWEVYLKIMHRNSKIIWTCSFIVFFPGVGWIATHILQKWPSPKRLHLGKTWWLDPSCLCGHLFPTTLAARLSSSSSTPSKGLSFSSQSVRWKRRLVAGNDDGERTMKMSQRSEQANLLSQRKKN